MDTFMFPSSIEDPANGYRYERFCSENVDAKELYDEFFASDEAERVLAFLPDQALTHRDNHGPPDTIKGVADYISAAEAWWENGNGAEYVIRDRDGQLVGNNTLGPIHWRRKSAHGSTWLRKAYWGSPASISCWLTLAKLCFEYLDLGVLVSQVVEENERMKNAQDDVVDAYNPGGLEYEGLLRNYFVVDGSPVNVHRYTCSKEGYFAAKAENEDGRELVESITFQR